MKTNVDSSAEFREADLAAIEAVTQEVGRSILARSLQRRPTPWDRRWWDDRIMSWAMQDESVKVQMFRFVDVLPMLTTREAVTRHLQEYFHDVKRHLPSAARLGLNLAAPNALAGRALAIAARRNVLAQARRFIAGTTADEVLAAAIRHRKMRRAFTVDLLGEAVTSQVEAQRYLDAYVDLIERIAPTVNRWPDEPQIDQGVLGELPRVNVSIKLSALDARFDAVDPRGTTRRVAEPLRTLLRTAREHRAFVNVDMESYATKDLTLEIFKSVLMEDEFRDCGDVGIVIQCYLKDAGRDLVALRDWARQREKPVWVRLVKGAYWDYETVHARATGWPVPVFEEKWQTDANFEEQTRFLFRNYEHLRPAVASHNVRSLAHAIAVARHIGLPPGGFELQMLYGMGDEEKQALVDLGYRLRVYMPYGELIPGMAYLVRRLLENTSNDSFLRSALAEDVAPETLLMNPHDVGESQRQSASQRTRATSRREPAGSELPDFQNEPPTDFAVAENRRQMEQALEQVRGRLGQHEKLVIGGVREESDEHLDSINPSHRREVIGTVAMAGPEHVEAAVKAARQALPDWWARGAEGRAEVLRDAARQMRERRFELAAWIVLEAGKPWRDADADVAEAIDFCEYYALGALALESRRGVDVPGEENDLDYLPRGVAAVISPWNFPLAILTGMTAAALATGNTVVMKPAEQTPIVAARLMEILVEAGAPPGVVNYLPGRGEVAGAALVEHPDVALIAFTGSREVGMLINRRAAEVSASGCCRFVKRVIAEMGGKNAIVIDDDADLDEAVLGVIHSAFGYQGQKCSACSRVVVVESAYEPFVKRLVEAARSLQIGPAEDPGTQVGPVIDEAALAKIHDYIEIARGEGRELLAVDVGPLAEEGFYVGPHLFSEIAPRARLGQEEVFGPVLAIMKAADFDEAIQIVNDTDYALTAGVYSRSPGHLEQARREILVGNLYLNRPITGALVGRQPFGGFKMSGMGSKAGGPDYLLQFVVPRTVTENTMRRGFAPSVEGE